MGRRREPAPVPAAPRPTTYPVDVLIADGSNVAALASGVSKRWRASAGPDVASFQAATAGALAWVAGAARWPLLRLALFDPAGGSEGGRALEDGAYLARRRARQAAKGAGPPPPPPFSRPPRLHPGLAAAARAAGFLPLAAAAGFEADDAAAAVLQLLADCDLSAATVSGDRGWAALAAAAGAGALTLCPTAAGSHTASAPRGWTVHAAPADEAGRAAAAAAPLIAALSTGGAGLKGAGLPGRTAASLAAACGGSLPAVLAAARAGAATAPHARDWRAVLGVEGSAAAAAAARAFSLLAPRPAGALTGADADAVVAAAARVAGKGGGCFSPLLAPPGAEPWLTPPSSRTTAWRHPEARARLRLLKPLLLRPATHPPFSSLASVSPQGVPVDAVGRGGESIFIGLPADYKAGAVDGGGRRGRAEARARAARAAAAAGGAPFPTAVVPASDLSVEQ